MNKADERAGTGKVPKRYQPGNCRRCGHKNPDTHFKTCPTCRGKMVQTAHLKYTAPIVCRKCGGPRAKYRELCNDCFDMPKTVRSPEQREAFDLFIGALIKEFNYVG